MFMESVARWPWNTHTTLRKVAIRGSANGYRYNLDKCQQRPLLRISSKWISSTVVTK